MDPAVQIALILLGVVVIGFGVSWLVSVFGSFVNS